MCREPYCFGDCEDCLEDKRAEKEREELNAECPHRKECKWIATSVKQDKCTTCGQIYNYS